MDVAIEIEDIIVKEAPDVEAAICLVKRGLSGVVKKNIRIKRAYEIKTA